MKFDADTAVTQAMDVFWRRGYSGTTPQALLDELGIGKGSFYNTFESKHKIFTLALERYKDNRLGYLAETFAEAGPIRERIEAAMQQLTGLNSHRRGCLMVNATAELAQEDEAVNLISESLFRGIEAAFADAVRRGQRDGEFAADVDADVLATSLLTTVVGSSILLKMGTDPGRADRAIADAIRAL